MTWLRVAFCAGVLENDLATAAGRMEEEDGISGRRSSDGCAACENKFRKKVVAILLILSINNNPAPKSFGSDATRNGIDIQSGPPPGRRTAGPAAGGGPSAQRELFVSRGKAREDKEVSQVEVRTATWGKSLGKLRVRQSSVINLVALPGSCGSHMAFCFPFPLH